jgi:hypothetical protein
MSKSYNVDIAKFPGYLAPHDSFAIFTPLSAAFSFWYSVDEDASLTPGFLTNNAITIYIILIEKRFRAFFTGLIFDAV